MFSDIVPQPHTDEGRLLTAAFQQTRMAMIATDPRQDDNPIIMINPSFQKLTGYSEAECVGRNCRFLQGENTDSGEVERIRTAIREEDEFFYTELLNYRKDGTPFWNALHVSAVHDDDGQLIYHFGSQWDVTERVENEQKLHLLAGELNHRIRNLFSLVISIAEGTSGDNYRDEVVQRLRALVGAHESVFAAGRGGAAPTPLRHIAEQVLSPYRVDMEGDDVKIMNGEALNLSLILHELATNAIKHGSLGAVEGRVALTWSAHGGRVDVDWKEKGGPCVEEPERRGFGSRLIDMVVRMSDRPDAGVDYAEDGLLCRFSLNTC